MRAVVSPQPPIDATLKIMETFPTRGFVLRRSERGCPIPPEAPSTTALAMVSKRDSEVGSKVGELGLNAFERNGEYQANAKFYFISFSCANVSI